MFPRITILLVFGGVLFCLTETHCFAQESCTDCYQEPACPPPCCPRRRCGLAAPPRVPIVTSVPAALVAQQAIAVRPRAIIGTTSILGDQGITNNALFEKLMIAQLKSQLEEKANNQSQSADCDEDISEEESEKITELKKQVEDLKHKLSQLEELLK
ncbi:hypothetical protein [Rubinisphaera sp.]|uniref:hypothetical protein n=1 Tax=Rubinisphaera sp. TaxID=2024857 RepID=UPI000C0F284F|nr:hypothetical protein [Rubinisphaera sp.]MBV08796.1 hypothetical protein [Rubinisphaera sp.]HCS52393.1 hypothetical protein [Planctomycetaceae bacterium]